MKQRFPVEASPRSSQNQFLAPALQAALVNLDVQLDEELARYRRQRSKRSASNPISSFRSPATKTLDLIAIGAVGDRIQPQESVGVRSPVALPEAADSSAFAPASSSPAPWFVDANAPAFLAVTPETGQSAYPDSDIDTLAPYSAEPDISALTHAADLGPEDYLESSEELLRSLAEEEAQVRAERGFVTSLLTPVGVGSLLLLLLSSATFGYLIMNPSSLGYLSQGGSSTSQNGNLMSQFGEAGSNGTSPAPYSINLADRELQSLNLNNLSISTTGLDRSTLSSPTTTLTKPKLPGSVNSSKTNPKLAHPSTSSNTQSSTSSATNTNQPRAAIAPAPSLPNAGRSAPAPLAPAPVAPTRTYNPAPPRRTVPAPQTALPVPRSVAPAPVPVAPVASSSYRYKVVIPYDGDRTLETVKQSVPDAYVRNLPDGGAVIQGGAFSSQQEAQQRVQQLQNQGLPAEMRQQ
ncbi:MAG: hypothetical protein KME16_01345 [Scytolyngbya sp. HA4215-MV1]|nr:hypothetical protein [Scytolyngbya sp. HA4215-MV1]